MIPLSTASTAPRPLIPAIVHISQAWCTPQDLQQFNTRWVLPMTSMCYYLYEIRSPCWVSHMLKHSTGSAMVHRSAPWMELPLPFVPLWCRTLATAHFPLKLWPWTRISLDQRKLLSLLDPLNLGLVLRLRRPRNLPAITKAGDSEDWSASTGAIDVIIDLAGRVRARWHTIPVMERMKDQRNKEQIIKVTIYLLLATWWWTCGDPLNPRGLWAFRQYLFH